VVHIACVRLCTLRSFLVMRNNIDTRCDGNIPDKLFVNVWLKLGAYNWATARASRTHEVCSDLLGHATNTF